MARTRQNIDQLAELIDGGVGASGAPAEIAQLAALADALRDSFELPTPSPAFREALRTQILEAPAPAFASGPTSAHPAERVRRFVEQRSPELLQSGRAVAATAAAAALVAAGGLGSVAQQSLPGDLLHPIKDATEDLRLAFSSGDLERGQLHLQFAEERLEELEKGLGRLTPDLIAATLDRLDDQVIAAANDLLAALEATGDLSLADTLYDFTADTGARLTALRAVVPAEVAGRVEDSLEILRRVDLQVDIATAVNAACDCDPQAAVAQLTQHDSVILRPGEGPAQPARTCDCNNRPAPSGAPVAPQPEPTPSTTPDPAPSDPPTESPVADDPETVPTLPGPVDPIGDEVEQIVDDLLEQLPVDPVQELPEPAQDLRRDVNEGIADVSQTVDDLLPGQLP